MREAQIQSLFGTHLRQNPPSGNYAYELKIIKKGNFRFKQVQERQCEALQLALNGFYHKIPDMAAQNGFSGSKAFDCLWVKFDETYVVPCFYKPREYKHAYLIPIQMFNQMRKLAVSLSKKQADDLVTSGCIERVSL